MTPEPGAVLGFNVCRDRHLGERKLWMQWSQTATGFHEPTMFGHLALAPRPDQLAELMPQFRKGGRDGPVIIHGQESTTAGTYLALANQTLRDCRQHLARLETLAATDADTAKRAEFAGKVAALAQRLNAAGTLDGAAWNRISAELNALRVALKRAVAELKFRTLVDRI